MHARPHSAWPLITAAVVAALGTATAGAQNAATANSTATADDLKEVVVTGSRIRRPALDSVVPVTSVGANEIMQQGIINLGDSLNDLPSLRSTYSISNSTRFIGTAGLSILDLRGLGTSRTLVLVNNRRHVTSSPGNQSVDVNTIPTDLVERIDIVTGGNSAVYGSDAVAGVVNFVTKRSFDGIIARAQMGTSKENDANSSFASIVAGLNTKDNRGNIAGAIEYSRQDPLYFTQRDSLTGAYSGRSQWNLASNSALDGATGSDGIIDNQFYTGVLNGTISDGGMLTAVCSAATLSNAARCRPSGFAQRYMFQSDGSLRLSEPSLDFRDITNGGSSNTIGGLGSTLRNTGQLRAGLKRYSINLLAHYDVNDALKPFVEAKFVRINAVQEGQPSFFQGSIPAFFGGGSDLRCDNPYLTAGAFATLQSIGRCATTASTFTISRFNVDFGGRGELHERDLTRVVGGIEGNFLDTWRYEVSVNYGSLKTSLDSLNNLRLFDLSGKPDGFLLAVDARRNAAGQIVCGVNVTTVTRPDCVPINVLGYGTASKEALAFVNTTAHRDQRATQTVVSGFLSGDSSKWFQLPGGPVGFAVGTDYRRETASSQFDELTASGGTFLNAIKPFAPPALTVKDVYAELRMPLLRDLPMIRELTAEAAGRSSNYNTATGTVNAFNLGLIWGPSADVRLRGNLSSSVRAPTQSDLFSPTSQNFASIADPCDVLYINANPNRAANCKTAGVPVGFINDPARARTLGFLSGGNPTLQAEKSRSYTIGTVITPRGLPGFSATVDYYNITVSNLIASLSAQTILNECYNSPAGIVGNPFCATVSRKADFTFNDPAVIAGGVNYARQETQGVDFDISYRYRRANGDQLTLRALWTHVLELNNYTNPSLPTYADRQLSELGDPQDAANISVGYQHGKFDFSYSLRYIGVMTLSSYEAQHRFQGRAPENADVFPRIWYPTVVYHGVKVKYEFNDHYQPYFGVDNISNKRPPYGLLGTGGGDPYDNVGRYYYVGINAKF